MWTCLIWRLVPIILMTISYITVSTPKKRNVRTKRISKFLLPPDFSPTSLIHVCSSGLSVSTDSRHLRTNEYRWEIKFYLHIFPSKYFIFRDECYKSLNASALADRCIVDILTCDFGIPTYVEYYNWHIID